MRKLFSSAVAMTWLSQAVSFGWMLAVMPLALREWTSTEVSLWLGLSLLTSLGMLADLGFRPTVVRAMAYLGPNAPPLFDDLTSPASEMPAGEKQCDPGARVGAMIAMIRKVYWGLTGIAAVLCLFPGILVVRNLIKLGGDRPADWWAYVFAVLQVLIGLNSGRYSALLEGLDLVAAVNRLQSVFSLIRLVVVVVLLSSGYGVSSVVFLGALLLVGQLLVFRAISQRTLRATYGLLPKHVGFDKKLFRWLWEPAWRSGAILTGSYLIREGTTIVVAQLPNPVTIASYLVTMRVLGFLGQLIRVPLYARIPRLNQLRAAKEPQEFKDFFSQRIAIVLGLAVIGLVLVNLVGDPLLALLARSQYGLVHGYPLLVLSLWLLLEVHHSAHAQAYMTTNHVPFMLPALISGAAILGLGYFAAKAYGVLGLVLVLFLVQLVCNNWYPVYLNLKSLRWPFFDYSRDVLSASMRLLRVRSVF